MGFLNTPLLFENLLEIGQFDIALFENAQKEIVDFEVPQNIPLGKRLEYFFENLINTSLNFELLAKNIQIFQDNQTIGEIDFIIKDTIKNQCYHIEFVYKYYLYFNKSEDEVLNLIGPNLNDSLIKKLQKIKTKQFPILNHKKTQNILNKIDAIDIVQKTCFLGNIYLPKNQNVVFKDINNACVKGFYTSINEFKENNTEYEQDEYFLPHRFDWVCEANTNTQWKSYDEILKDVQEFIDMKKSPLVFGKTKENEFFSFFITYYEII